MVTFNFLIFITRQNIKDGSLIESKKVLFEFWIAARLALLRFQTIYVNTCKLQVVMT